MSRPAALSRLARDVQADLTDYAMLRDALAHVFDAAMRHESERMAELTAQVGRLVDTLNQRRDTRVALTRALTGDAAPRSLDGVLAQLAPAAREQLASHWRELEALVRECKQLNSRNCAFVVEQHALMQRVLHGEEGVYVGS